MHSPDLSESPSIAALATAPGAGAIAVIRISGERCLEQLAPLLQVKSWDPNQLLLAKIVDPVTDVVVDEPMVAFFHAPRSYTGENAAEIHLHGSPYIVQRVLALLATHGISAAKPGEFTRRAFLHGKMDLTTAEGVAAMIGAHSEQQWLAARQLTSGRMRVLMDDLRRQVIEAMAYLEAQIDFPDEGDVEGLQLQAVDLRVQIVQATLADLLRTYQSGRIASQGLKVAIVGLPNAGKSTLLNTLLQEERAIVTPIPGTTRDFIEEGCLLEGRLLRLIDTAGIRDSVDTVEAIGIKRALGQVAQADLVLVLHAFDDDPILLQPLLDKVAKDASTILVHTKSDLDTLTPPGWLPISCKTGAGIDELRSAIIAHVDANVRVLGDALVLSSARHQQAVAGAVEALDQYGIARSSGAYEEMLAFELQTAARLLGDVIGLVGNEDVLDTVFSSFCLGK